MSQECENLKTFVAIISQSCDLIWMEFGMLMTLVGLMNVILILPSPINIKGREPYLCDFIIEKKNKKTLACTQTFTDRFFSNLVWW